MSQHEVGPNRGYRSAEPSATTHALRDEPILTSSCSPSSFANFSSLSARWLPLATSRVWVFVCLFTEISEVSASVILVAGTSIPPSHVVLLTGAWTTPKIGFHRGPILFIRAMFTVNIPFLLMNSLVPSRGSTSHANSLFFGSPTLPSSETTGTSGSMVARPLMMVLCAAMSALVSGESSSLDCTSI